MESKRYIELQHDSSALLTKDELQEGWHWCAEMDGLLCIFISVSIPIESVPDHTIFEIICYIKK